MNEKAKVYFTNFRANPKMNLLQKLKKLIIEAGMTEIDFENKFTAINPFWRAWKYRLSPAKFFQGCGGAD